MIFKMGFVLWTVDVLDEELALILYLTHEKKNIEISMANDLQLENTSTNELRLISWERLVKVIYFN